MIRFKMNVFLYEIRIQQNSSDPDAGFHRNSPISLIILNFYATILQRDIKFWKFDTNFAFSDS